MADIVKLVLPAAKIPAGATITKKTGEVRYTVVDSITVHSGGGKRLEIPAEDGARFLVNNERPTDNIRAIPGTTELIWLARRTDALDYIEGSA